MNHNHQMEKQKDGQSLNAMYTCPMHPQVRKNEPGLCPACGMPLIPSSDKTPATESHADHEAAMTNPQIAKAMEADMRRRFLISFLLSIPIFLYSPVGVNVFKLSLPDRKSVV